MYYYKLRVSFGPSTYGKKGKVSTPVSKGSLLHKF